MLSIGIAPGLALLLPRLLGKRIILTPDGIEWQRATWSGFIRFWLRLSEYFAIKFSNVVVADSRAIAEYIIHKYRKSVSFAPYGADVSERQSDDLEVLAKYGLKAQEYFLQVCRIEPENNCHVVISEFLQYRGNKILVIIGDTPHSIKYRDKLTEIANHNVKFLGSVYGTEHMVILRNAYCYIHGHEAGGTNPALLEAMASATCPVVLNTAYNLEVIAGCGISFSKDKGDLAAKLEASDCDTVVVGTLGQKALRRVQSLYTWSDVISKYERVFLEM